MTNPGDVLIRTAGREDAAEIVALVRLLAAENAELTCLTEDYAEAYLAAADRGVLLAVADGEAVAMLSWSIRPNLYHAASSLTIEELVVRPSFRRLGLGKRLVEEAVSIAGEKCCAEVSVSTGFENEPAQHLYRGLGLADESLLLERHL